MTRLKARIRLFRIWQLTGRRPFAAKRSALAPIVCPYCGTTFDTPYCPECGQAYKSRRHDGFYKGSFDSIPFLNEGAKRTFVHLILRPGYMIRDYIRGMNSSYLAPLTALIIFYAFLALVSSVVAPLSTLGGSRAKADRIEEIFSSVMIEQSEGTTTDQLIRSRMSKVGTALSNAYIWLHLDTMPEEVDTRLEQSVAAMETTLRSRGVPRFLGGLILLTICIWLVFRKKYQLSLSASATTASYILCQFCFFMLLAVLVSLGKDEKISGLIMAALLLVDYRQMFGISWRRSLSLTIKTALAYLLLICLLSLLVLLAIVAIAASAAGL